MFDVAVIGAGPGGMQAAIFAASEGLSTCIVERDKIGGQIGQTPKLENLLGHSCSGISGPELAENMRSQAAAFGVQFIKGDALHIGEIRDGNRIVTTLDGNRVVYSKVAVIASGASWNKFEVPGVAPLVGTRVHYGPFHCMSVERGLDYAVIGGGNSSGQAIMELAQHASSVQVVTRSSVKCSAYLKERISRSPNVRTHFDVEVVRIIDTKICLVLLLSDGQHVQVDHTFFCGGLTPNTNWLKNTIELDTHGYILTNENGNATSMRGVFALGDCRKSHYRKSVANSIGDASNVITQIHRYLDSLNVPSVGG
jgi:thioredoxin reductase (NADPH)